MASSETGETPWLGRMVGLAALVLAGLAIALWVRFGPTVFAEMISSAWTACF